MTKLQPTETTGQKNRLAYEGNLAKRIQLDEFTTLYDFERPLNYSLFVKQTQDDLQNIALEAGLDPDNYREITLFCDLIRRPELIAEPTKELVYKGLPVQLEEIRQRVQALYSEGECGHAGRAQQTIINLLRDLDVCLPGTLNNIYDALNNLRYQTDRNTTIFNSMRDHLIIQHIICFVQEAYPQMIIQHNHLVAAFKWVLDDSIWKTPHQATNDIYVTPILLEEAKTKVDILKSELLRDVTTKTIVTCLAEEIHDRAAEALAEANPLFLSMEQAGQIVTLARTCFPPVQPSDLLEYRYQDSQEFCVLRRDTSLTRLSIAAFLDEQGMLSDAQHNEWHVQCNGKSAIIHVIDDLWWWTDSQGNRHPDMTFNEFMSLDHIGPLPKALLKYAISAFGDTLAPVWRTNWSSTAMMNSLFNLVLPHTQLLRLWLKTPGVNLTHRSPEDYLNTPLHNAIDNDVKAAIDLLLAHPRMDKQALNARDVKGLTPLMHAVESSNPRSALEILRHSCCDRDVLGAEDDCHNNLLFYALEARIGRKEILHSIVTHPAFHQDILTHTDQSGKTPFIFAIEKNDLESLIILINNKYFDKAMLTEQTFSGRSALETAIITSEKITDYILSIL